MGSFTGSVARIHFVELTVAGKRPVADSEVGHDPLPVRGDMVMFSSRDFRVADLIFMYGRHNKGLHYLREVYIYLRDASAEFPAPPRSGKADLTETVALLK